ncbi:hypothetical protein QOT17_004966 [Balamuthia mandrillaris]
MSTAEEQKTAKEERATAGCTYNEDEEVEDRPGQQKGTLPAGGPKQRLALPSILVSNEEQEDGPSSPLVGSSKARQSARRLKNERRLSLLLSREEKFQQIKARTAAIERSMDTLQEELLRTGLEQGEVESETLRERKKEFERLRSSALEEKDAKIVELRETLRQRLKAEEEAKLLHENEVKKLNIELDEVERQGMREIRRLKAQLERAEKEKEMMAKALMLKTKEASGLRDRNKELEQVNVMVEKNMISSSVLPSASSSSFITEEMMDNNVQRYKEKLEEANRLRAEIEKERDELEDQLMALRFQLEDEQRKLKVVQNEKKELSEHIAEMELEMSKGTQRLNDMRKVFEEQKTKISYQQDASFKERRPEGQNKTNDEEDTKKEKGKEKVEEEIEDETEMLREKVRTLERALHEKENELQQMKNGDIPLDLFKDAKEEGESVQLHRLTRSFLLLLHQRKEEQLKFRFVDVRLFRLHVLVWVLLVLYVSAWLFMRSNRLYISSFLPPS